MINNNHFKITNILPNNEPEPFYTQLVRMSIEFHPFNEVIWYSKKGMD